MLYEEYLLLPIESLKIICRHFALHYRNSNHSSILEEMLRLLKVIEVVFVGNLFIGLHNNAFASCSVAVITSCHLGALL